MEHNFEYRQRIRMARLEARRKAAYRRRVRTLTVVFTSGVCHFVNQIIPYFARFSLLFLCFYGIIFV